MGLEQSVGWSRASAHDERDSDGQHAESVYGEQRVGRIVPGAATGGRQCPAELRWLRWRKPATGAYTGCDALPADQGGVFNDV